MGGFTWASGTGRGSQREEARVSALIRLTARLELKRATSDRDNSLGRGERSGKRDICMKVSSFRTSDMGGVFTSGTMEKDTMENG